MTLKVTSVFGNVKFYVLGQLQQVTLNGVSQAYGSSWQYILGNTVTEITVAANQDIFISYQPGSAFPYVTDLRYSVLSDTSLILVWSTPNLTGLTFQGYEINYTTPYGTPLTVIVPNTGSPTTSYSVTGLSNLTQYSFRVGTIASGINWVNLANILNVTTLSNTMPVVTVGNLDLNVGTNPLSVPFKFTRHDLNSTALQLYVNYPNYFNTTCNFNFEFANTNKTYSNLVTTPNGTGRVYALFQFVGINSEVINTKCVDVNSNTTGRFVITQNNIPLVQQVQAFQAGQFGTQGLFAGFDLVELLILIIAMIGLNRVNETIGTITMLVIIGFLAFFHIGSFSVLIVSALSLVIMVAIITTRKLAYT